MTDIEWCDRSVNPVIGCSKVSEGCKHCYAETLAVSMVRRRLPVAERYRQVVDGRHWSGRAVLDRAMMSRARTSGARPPMRVRNPDGSWRPARIFCVSMGDLFHESLSVEEIAEVWRWMGDARVDARGRLHRGPTWIVVTKRPERAAAVLGDIVPPSAEEDITPRPHVHLLTTVESQEHAAPRLDALTQIPTGPDGLVDLVGVSAEPLLGPLDLRPWIDRLGWVIPGAESGPGARPCYVRWIEDLVHQCRDARVPVFVKQLGRRPMLGNGWASCLFHERKRWPGEPPPIVIDPQTADVTAWLADAKGGDPREWPEDLRIREWP